MRFLFRTPITTAVYVAVGLLFSYYPETVRAAELDCAVLAGQLKDGDDFQLKLELQSQSIRIEHGQDYCSEPATTWFARALILPQPARRETALPPSALVAPDSEVIVRSRSSAESNDVLPLPGQQMRQGTLPDLGFGSTEREIAPLPIQRAAEKPAAGETLAGENVAEQSPAGATGQPEVQPSATISRVNVSGNAEEGSTKFTNYKAEIKKTASTQTPGLTDQPPAQVDPNAAISGAQSPKAGSEKPEEPEKSYTCDRELTDFWQAGEHMVDGQKVYLSGVFTLDLDNDGRTDNVGFKIGARGRIGNILNYFAVTEGRLSAGAIDTLKLQDDKDLHRICAGNVMFQKMSKAERVKAVTSAKRRQTELTQKAELAKKKEPAEIEAKKEVEKETPEQSAEKNTEQFMFWVISAASVFFFFGGIGLFFVIRSMRSSDDDDEYEDDDDEDEED